MKTLISLIVLTLLASLVSFGQTNPKKNYYGKGLTYRFKNWTQTELKNYEFTEVLNTADLLTKVSNNIYVCKIFYCFNGDPDPELDYCNNSTNYYISNGTYDLPNEFKLFKIGPFYAVDSAYVSNGSTEEAYIFTILHRRADKKFTNKYLIAFDKLTLLKD